MTANEIVWRPDLKNLMSKKPVSTIYQKLGGGLQVVIQLYWKT